MGVPCYTITDHEGNKLTLEEFQKKFKEDKQYRASFNKAASEAPKLREDIKDFKNQATDILKAAVEAVKQTEISFKEKRAKVIESVESARQKFKDGLKDKKITSAQYKTVVNKITNITKASEAKLENAVQDFSNYIDKIGNIADTKAEFNSLIKNRDVAKKILAKAKTFTETRDVSIVKDFLNIDPKKVSTNIFEEYSDIMNTISSPEALTKADKQSLIQRTENLLSSYKNTVIDTYEKINEHIDNNANLQGKTLEEVVSDMESNNVITSIEKDFILENKDIFDISDNSKGRSPKTPYDQQQRSDINQEAMQSVTDYENTLKTGGRVSNINNNDRAVVDSVIDKMKVNGKEWMDSLSDRQLDKVNHALKMMNNDFITADLNILIDREIDVFNKKKAIDNELPNVNKGIKKLRDFAISARLKTIGGNLIDLALSNKGKFNKATFEQVQRFQKQATDQVFETSNGVLNKTFFAEQAMNLGKHEKYVFIKEKEFINPIRSSIKKLFNGDIKGEVTFNTKLSMYLLQRRFNLNPDQPLVSIDRFVEAINKKTGQEHYNEGDLKKINDQLEAFKQIGLENHEAYLDTFSEKEKAIVKKIDEFFNSDVKQKAESNAKFLNGKVLAVSEGYFPVELVYDGSSKISLEEQMKDGRAGFFNPSLKSGNIQDIKGSTGEGTNRIVNLTDPIGNMERYLEGISMQYHNEELVIRTNKVLNSMVNNEGGKYTKSEVEFAKLMKDMVSKSVQSMVAKSSGVDLLPPLLSKLKGNIVYSKISGGLKGPSEFASNVVNSIRHLEANQAGLNVLKQIRQGKLDIDKLSYNIGFAQGDRIGNIFPKRGGAESNIDMPSLNKTEGNTRSVSPFMNSISKIYSKSGIPKVREGLGYVSDILFVPADRAVATNIAFGIFDVKFKQKTGEYPDYKKIQDGEVEYMDKHKENIKSSVIDVDSFVAELIGSKNAFEVKSNSQVDMKDPAYRKLYVEFNSFLSGHQNAQSSAVYIAIKKAQTGEGSKSEAVKTIISKLLSQYTYTKGMQVSTKALFATVIAPILGVTVFDDDEEKENQLTRNVLSSGFQLGTGASGNFGKSAFGFVEAYAEDKYGQGITREGVMTKGNASNYSSYDPRSSAWDNILNATASVRGSYGVVDSDQKKLQEDLANKNILGVVFDVAPFIGKVPFIKDINSMRSQLKYRSIPSLEDQRETYKSGTAKEISDLNGKMYRYAKVKVYNEYLKQFSKYGDKATPAEEAKIMRAMEKSFPTIKQEIKKRILVSDSELDKLLTVAVKSALTRRAIREDMFSDETKKYLQMKKEDAKDDILLKLRDARNSGNQKEWDRLKEIAIQLNSAGVIDDSAVSDYVILIGKGNVKL
jgi:hypothetical protein